MIDFDSLPEDPPAVTRAPANPGASVSFDALPDDEEKYGTLPQQALTVGEGAVKGLLGPLGSLAETKLGLTTGQDIRNRAETNPILHYGSELAGFAAPAILTAGGSAEARVGLGALAESANLANVSGKIGKGAAALTGLGGEGAGIASRLGAAAVKGGAEFAALQAADETSKLIEGDPNQSVGSAAINIGLSSILGAGGHVAIGAVSPLWKATAGDITTKLLDGVKAQAGATEVNQGTLIDSLKNLKPNASEIKEAAETLGAPLLESQVSASKHIQDLDSVLINSPSPVGVARQQLLQKGVAKAEAAVNGVLGTGGDLSQVDVGNAIKESLTSKLQAEAKPINELYETLKQSTDHIPVSENAKSQIAANISKLEDFKFSGSATEKFGKNAIENLPNINTVDDIKRYKSILNSSLSPTASPAERFAVGQISEKLSNLEENTIIRQAESLASETQDPAVKQNVLDLITQRKEANTAYKALREKMSDLGESLGKKRIAGPQSFIDFVNDLTPEAITKKLFSKGNSEALQSFSQAFPEESQLLFQHQKNVIKQAALKDGSLSANRVLKELDKLSPEVKSLMFSKDELGQLKAAKTYMESLPKNINPSGTSKSEAYRRFFTNPVSASLQTGADYGIGKIISAVVPKDALEKSVAAGSHDAFFNHVFPAMEPHVLGKETNASAFKSAVDYGLNVLKGQKVLDASVKGVFRPGAQIISNGLLPDQASRDKLEKSLEKYKDPDPTQAINSGGDLGHYLPDHAAAAAQTGSMAANYLNSLRPKEGPDHPLDSPTPPDKIAQEKYNRALDIAQQPLMVLQHAKQGMLLPSDVQAIQAIYPDLYKGMLAKVQNELINHTAKGHTIPYAQRQSLNLLIGGNALDGTMTPAAMQAVITSAAAAPQQQPQPAQKHGASGSALSQINKTNALYQTPLQARQFQKRA